MYQGQIDRARREIEELSGAANASETERADAAQQVQEQLQEAQGRLTKAEEAVGPEREAFDQSQAKLRAKLDATETSSLPGLHCVKMLAKRLMDSVQPVLAFASAITVRGEVLQMAGDSSTWRSSST